MYCEQVEAPAKKCEAALPGKTIEHPRTAMAWLESDRRDDIVGYYDEMVSKEDLH